MFGDQEANCLQETGLWAQFPGDEMEREQKVGQKENRPEFHGMCDTIINVQFYLFLLFSS
jgi:hypothetical protein